MYDVLCHTRDIEPINGRDEPQRFDTGNVPSGALAIIDTATLAAALVRAGHSGLKELAMKWDGGLR